MTSTRSFLALLITACAASEDAAEVSDSSGGKADDTAGTRRLPADLPAWGGSDAARWSPEAIVANAVTVELQRDPSARVSIPAVLWTSHLAPFGDGQTNAAVSLASWRGTRPPVIGTRRGTRVTVRFDRTLPISDDTFEVWTQTGAWMTSVASTRTTEGDWMIAIDEPLDRFVVSPRGWRDGFPLSFALPVTSVDALARTLPASQRTLPEGEPVVDPVGAAGDSAYATLRVSSFPAGFVNQTPYVSDDLHAAFPQSGAPRITAVGGASTWVAEAPFKNLYVCFDERSLGREAQYGVPSGAGWHHIGDAGESIVSSLEDSPVLVGHAAGAPAAPPSGGGFAYGLDRATTYALLQPGQAFTTPRGDFHWYAVHHAQHPCVQIWVHACAPDPDAPSMACD